MPKMLCFVASLLALLLSAREEYAAVLPWTIGVVIAVISVSEKIQPQRAM